MSDLYVDVGDQEAGLEFGDAAAVPAPFGYEDYILFLGFNQDNFPIDPRECGCKIYSFNRRDEYSYPLSQLCPTEDELRDEIQKDYGPHIRFLGRFEHSRVLWHREGHRPFGTEGDYRWDGRDFAGVWIPSEDMVEHAESAKDPEHVINSMCTRFLEDWNAYINGEFYTAYWEVYALLRTATGRLKTHPASYTEDEPLDCSSLGNLLWEDLEEYSSLVVSDVEAALQRLEEAENGNMA